MGPMSTTAKRKMFIPPSWMKKPHGFGSHSQRGVEPVYGDEEMRVVQEVLGQMIFQAGVDYECVVGFSRFFELDVKTYLSGRGRCKERES
jgi:hypothetical protein